MWYVSSWATAIWLGAVVVALTMRWAAFRAQRKQKDNSRLARRPRLAYLPLVIPWMLALVPYDPGTDVVSTVRLGLAVVPFGLLGGMALVYAGDRLVGVYRPRRIVDNDEACRLIDSSDAWVRSRSGIVTRRWAGPDETLTVMGEVAAAKALAAAGVAPTDVGCVITATFTHLKQTPAVATQIADRIGARNAAAFDVSAGCAGFVYAVALAEDAVRSRGGHVLVVGVERMTDILNLRDRSTAFIFGDGAGAVVIGPSDRPAFGPVVWGADGSQADAIEQTVPWDMLRTAPGHEFPWMRQDGQRVFRWAVYEMAKVAAQALEAAGLTPQDLDVFIPHQANVRIIDALSARLRLPESVRVAKNLVTEGNTSGASIPLAMEAMLESGEARQGDTALLLGYGAGLSYAAVVATLP